MIKENIAEVKKRIAAACLRAKRAPDSVAIAAVSKGRSIEEIKEVINCGITDIGENKIQEALLKCKELLTPNSQLPTIKWHMVGHLQTNKAKDAVKIFDLVHSVDSLHLAQEIDKQAVKINKVQDILVEIKTSAEATKFGLNPDDATGIIKEISSLKNINIKGLMTIAPIVDDPEKARPYFRMLKEIMDTINRQSSIVHRFSILSMGMTDDFEVAVEEGATMVRLGRAIFNG